MNETLNKNANLGVVKISDDVVCVIAGIAAAEINGIVEINQGVTGGITHMLTGKKNVTKGVKVTPASQNLCNLWSSYHSTKGNSISNTLQIANLHKYGIRSEI